MTTTETVTQYNVRKPDGTLFAFDWLADQTNAGFQAQFLASQLAQLGAVGPQAVTLVQRTVTMEIGDETVVLEARPEWEVEPGPIVELPTEETMTEAEEDELLADEPALSDDFDTPQAN